MNVAAGNWRRWLSTKMSRNFFHIFNTFTNASNQITHGDDNSNKNCRQSAVLLECSRQALLDVCIAARYIFLSPLFCPGCIKWIKAVWAAKHIFISSTLRVRTADSRQHIMECHKIPGPSLQIKDGRLKSLGEIQSSSLNSFCCLMFCAAVFVPPGIIVPWAYGGKDMS